MRNFEVLALVVSGAIRKEFLFIILIIRVGRENTTLFPFISVPTFSPSADHRTSPSLTLGGAVILLSNLFFTLNHPSKSFIGLANQNDAEENLNIF
jgi:hypothetical protein